MIDRRTLLLSGLAIAATGAKAPTEKTSPQATLEALRERLGPGGRLGVAASDGLSSRLSLDPDGRYAMCSTFKMPLAAAMLAGADAGLWSMNDALPLRPSDLVPHAPVTERMVEQGWITIDEACAAIMTVSDNPAANLLLRRLGGPERFNEFVRRCGDGATRLDRIEPELNANLPGDPRDTTTPAAMIGLMRILLFGDVLSRGAREKLAGWMISVRTGLDRLRAGFPEGWTAGDKTGTGANGAHNDIAFVLRPRRAPIIIASYIDGGTASAAERSAVHAEVARIILSTARI